MQTTKLLWSTCALLAMTIALLASQAQAGEVQLAWDAATGDPAGYKLYYGQASRSYQGAINVGLKTIYTLSGLTDGKRYYFSATAYDTAGNESAYSNEVTTVISSGPPTSGGLVAAYKFDEGSGTTVTDASGMGNHGTISGATWTTGGRYGKALLFDGVNDWVTIPAAASLNLTTDMTLEAWVYPGATLTNWHAVVVKEGSGMAPYYLYASSSYANRPAGGGYFGGGYQELSGGTSLVAQTWTHLAMTYDGITQRLYVNGKQVTSRAQSGALAVSTGPLRMGGDSLWGDYFQGRLDEVRIYKRALTASEIQTDMATPISSSLVAAYKFDEGSGTTVTDASGMGNHGTISGATWTTGGRYGKALLFDGVNDWVTIPAAASLNLTTDMTLEAWVYPGATLTNWHAVVVKEGSGMAPYYLYASSSYANRPAGGGYFGGRYQELSGGTSLVAQTWTHLAMTYDGITQRLYVNGKQVTSRAQSGALAVSTGPLRMGGDSLWGDYFQGRLDEVRIYKRALTASEIQTDMTTPIGAAGSTSIAGIAAPATKTQPNSKSRVAAAVDKLRQVKSALLSLRTATSASKMMSTNDMSSAPQPLDSGMIEVGEVEVDHHWKRVELSRQLLNPVVIAKTASSRGGEPVVVRIEGVDPTGFDIRIQQREDDDGDRVSETVGYIVIESGRYTLADGTLMEAGIVDLESTKSFGSIAFRGKFNVVPVVITAVSSVNDMDALALRPSSITNDGFQVGVEQRTFDQPLQSPESISYIAWEPSSGIIDNMTFEVNKTAQVTRHQFHTIPFAQTFENFPVLLGDVQVAKGWELLNVLWTNKDVSGAEVMIADEQSHDSDPAETGVVGYIVIR